MTGTISTGQALPGALQRSSAAPPTPAAICASVASRAATTALSAGRPRELDATLDVAEGGPAGRGLDHEHGQPLK